MPGLLLTVTVATSQEQPDRSKRPAPQPVPHIALPAIRKAALANGLSVWLVERHKLPQVAFSLVLQSGADQDPEGKAGAASLTAELLDGGTKTRGVLEIAEQVEFLGSSMNFRAGIDATFGGLVTLTNRLGESLTLFADVLTNPVFPEMEFERIRKQRLAALLQQKDRAAAIATIAFMHVLYGPGHPYGMDASGTESSVQAMTRDDITAFYDAHYRPNNATLIVAGDATMEDLLPRLERTLQGWQPAPVKFRTPPPPPAIDRRRIYLIDKTSAPQSEIRIGYPALARTSPDYFTVMVMNRILGGQFSSRINMNLRERRGYTYGARSAFIFLKQAGPFMASGGFIAGKTDSSVEQIIYEVDRMHREGVTEDELAFAKKGLAGSFALNFETPSQIAGALQAIVLYGLPEDYYADYLQNIDRVALEDVQSVAGRTLDPEKMAVLVVGDERVVRGGLVNLGLGDVVILDAEGNPLAAQ